MDIKKEDKMIVKMLGHFEIQYKGIILNSETIRSNMVELLLVYMLLQRHKEVLTNELAEELWSEEESDNPLGALKNLMYRLRKLLKDVFGEDDIIVTGRGSYTINPSIAIELDAEVFETKLKLGKEKDDRKALEEAMELYVGTFLPKQAKQHWILQQSVYYQSLFSSYSKVLIEMLEKEEYFEEMEAWCLKALTYDPLDENLQYHFILSLLKQGKSQIALEHYLHVKQRLYDELGVDPSEELQQLYQTMIRKDNDRQLDLVVIQKDLNEEELPNKAYYCDYNVFKEMYRLDARRLQRLGISMYCCLITCDVTLPIPQTSKLYKTVTVKMMDSMKDLLLKSLRAGDIVSRYSQSQYVMLLPTCSFESMQVVIDRIKKEFEKEEVSKQGKLLFDFKELILEG